MEDQEDQLHHHPVQSLPLDLIYFSINTPDQTWARPHLVVMFLLQLQLAVQLGDGVENLSKVGALEDPKHDGAQGVAHDGAQVGVHCHLQQNKWSLTLFETEMENAI